MFFRNLRLSGVLRLPGGIVLPRDFSSGGSASSLVHQVSVTLTNDQILHLPSLPVDLVPAAGLGTAFVIGEGVYVFDNAEAYTNINANARLALTIASSNIYAAGNMINHSGAGWTDVTNALGKHRLFSWTMPATLAPASDLESTTAFGVLQSLGLPFVVENQPIQMTAGNPDGDFLGGDPANTLQISCMFYVRSIALNRFLTVAESGWNETTRLFE